VWIVEKRENEGKMSTLVALPPLKPHQRRGIDALGEHRQRSPGVPVCGVAPPGAGKSRCMMEMTIDEVQRGGRVVIYVHRTMLREQLVRNFEEAGIPAANVGPDANADLRASVLIASIQTMHQRVIKQQRWTLPDASLVLIDEAHQQAANRNREIVFGAITQEKIIKGHAQSGADVAGMTATPLMRPGLYRRLIPFGSYSELRREGMHLPVRVMAGDEIDTSGLAVNKSGEFSEKKLEERAPVIFGNAYDEWRRWNPDARPALLFAPSVPCSRWFAQEWAKKGVMAAHIGSDAILMPERRGDGTVRLEQYSGSQEVRDALLERSKSGEVEVISNRFVLREAIDMPWLYHAIFATVMGSLTTFLQSVGRIQRFHPDYDFKILQDHGGAFWRHGSPNEDRNWQLGDTVESVRRKRELAAGNGEEDEGIRCEVCGAVRRSGETCWNCQEKQTTSVRAVRQTDGTLKRMTGRVHKQRSKASGKSAGDIWRGVWFGSGHQDRSIKQAVARWQSRCREQGITPDYSQINPPLPERGSYEYENMSMQQFYPSCLEAAKKSKKRKKS